MNHSTPPDCELKSTSTLQEQPGVLVVRKHHFLVRWSHWLNVPILLASLFTGLRRSINTSQIRIRETSMWRRILESGYAPMCLACITTTAHPTGFTTT